jgi:hypothetical protein
MKINKLWRIPMLIAFLALLICTYACNSESLAGKLFSQMGDLFKIKRSIDESLIQGESAIHIQNGRIITLDLINTEYNDEEALEREKAADKILDILLANIGDKKKFEDVEKVLVNFIHYEKKFLVVDFTMTVDYYEFTL